MDQWPVKCKVPGKTLESVGSTLNEKKWFNTGVHKDMIILAWSDQKFLITDFASGLNIPLSPSSIAVSKELSVWGAVSLEKTTEDTRSQAVFWVSAQDTSGRGPTSVRVTLLPAASPMIGPGHHTGAPWPRQVALRAADRADGKVNGSVWGLGGDRRSPAITFESHRYGRTMVPRLVFFFKTWLALRKRKWRLNGRLTIAWWGHGLCR